MAVTAGAVWKLCDTDKQWGEHVKGQAHGGGPGPGDNLIKINTWWREPEATTKLLPIHLALAFVAICFLFLFLLLFCFTVVRKLQTER